MQEAYLLIEQPAFELTAVISNDCLHLTLFHQLEMKYFQCSIPFEKIPRQIGLVFSTVLQLYSYLQYIKERSEESDYSLMDFYCNCSPHLTIRSTICNGQKIMNTSCFFQAANQEETFNFLRQRMDKEQNQLKKLRNLCNHEYRTKEENLQIEKVNFERLVRLKKKQENLEKIVQEKILKKNKLVEKFQNQRQLLGRLNSLQEIYVLIEEKEEKEQYIIQFSLTLTQKLKKIIKIQENRIQILNCSRIAEQIPLTSNVTIPLIGKWAIYLKIYNLNHGLTIGLKQDSDNTDSMTNYSYCAGISTEKQISFLFGLNRLLKEEVSLKLGDQFTMILDRSSNSVKFFINCSLIEEIILPIKLKNARVYPFVVLNAGDIVNIAELSSEDK